MFGVSGDLEAEMEQNIYQPWQHLWLPGVYMSDCLSVFLSRPWPVADLFYWGLLHLFECFYFYWLTLSDIYSTSNPAATHPPITMHCNSLMWCYSARQICLLSSARWFELVRWTHRWENLERQQMEKLRLDLHVYSSHKLFKISTTYILISGVAI